MITIGNISNSLLPTLVAVLLSILISDESMAAREAAVWIDDGNGHTVKVSVANVLHIFMKLFSFNVILLPTK